MARGEPVALRLPADPTSPAEARRFVRGHLTDWGVERFGDDLALCTAELATNAVLHARTPFTVAVRPLRSGVRVDVQDDRYDRLPALPPVGLGPLDTGTTGRGLRLVAGLASRWGYFNTERAKTVWVELSDRRPGHEASPVVEVAWPTAYVTGTVRLIDLPVAAAVASGVQVDDLVRAIQLEPERLSEDEQKEFFEVLERTARFRLVGRHEAYRAASEALDRVTVDIQVSAGDLTALNDLTGLLRRVAARSGFEEGQVPPEVQRMRAWLGQEVAAQLSGEPPSPYSS